MPKIIGRTGAVGIGIETTKGTKVAAAYWVPVQSYSYDDKIEHVTNDSAMGRIEELNAAHISKLYGEGDFEGKIFLNSVGAELVAVLGASPTSVQRASTGVYDHTYAVANTNNHKALTVAYEDGIQEVSFPFAMVNTWSLDIANDDYVKRTISLTGKKSESATHTPAFVNEVEFIPSQVTFKTASTAAGLGAASAINVTNFSMEIAKNAEPFYTLGSNEPTDIINKQFSVTGSVDLYFEATTQRADVFANTHKAMQIRMLDTSTDLGSSHNPELYFNLNEVAFTEFSRSWDANDPLKQTLNFTALYNMADAAMISARLTNRVVSY
jgi:ribosomal protein L31